MKFYFCLSCFLTGLLFLKTAYSESAKENTSKSKELNDASTFTYQMKKVEKTVRNNKTESGDWSIYLQYPAITNPEKQKIVDTVNLKIESIVSQYSCGEIGERSFIADVVFLSSEIFSLTYEAMIMCPKMPRPDFEAGAITFELTTGKQIQLKEHIKKDKHTSLRKLISERAKLKIEERESSCPSIPEYNIVFPSEQGINFSYVSSYHGNVQCNYEITLGRKEASAFFIKLP